MACPSFGPTSPLTTHSKLADCSFNGLQGLERVKALAKTLLAKLEKFCCGCTSTWLAAG